nr:unnamed protein product [Callosobruchus analis]
MPQELALYGEFSINETMLYFGWIYGLKTKQIKEKVTFLVQLLDLPPAKRLVKNLSGGQQRRVSLAVAVMHEPELLILDEPTVGVDPILRANIWNYMVRETKEKKISIIITTHYIEEARQAQTIGLMRNGELLAEDAPAQLLKTFGCTTMEEVFLKLSRQQEASGKQQLPASFSEGPRRPKGKTIGENAESNEDLAEEKYGCCNRICYSLKQCMSCVRLRALLFRNLLRLIRNLLVLLFVFALPVIQVVLFCICVGNDPKQLTLGVVNHETDYTNSTYIHCPYGFSCTVSTDGGVPDIAKWEYMSCGYLKYLEVDTLRLRYYPHITSCKKAVHEGFAWGCMLIKSSFSEALLLRALALLQNDLSGSARYASDTEIQVWLDMSNHQIAHTLKRDITAAFENFTKDLMEECKIESRLFKQPMNFEPVYGSNWPSFTAFAAPGVLLTIVFFLAVGLTATALIIERLDGLLNRAYVAGVTPSEILLSHVITQFIIMVGQTILALIFMIAVFKVDCIGSVALVISMTLLQGLCGMCFGFVISAVCSQERNAIQLALGSFYPAILLSGVMWPIEAMPVGLR